MFKGIPYWLFLFCCVVAGIRSAEDENALTSLSEPSRPVSFSIKNKSERPIFIVLADGERVQNGSVKWTGKEHARRYRVILNQALMTPNSNINFVIMHELSQATLYIWEGDGIDGARKFDTSVLDQLGLSIAQKQFDIKPTAIFRFNPGRNVGVHLKWKFGQLLPRSEGRKFGRNRHINNINKNQIRQFNFGQNNSSAQLSSSSSPTNSSLRRSGLID